MVKSRLILDLEENKTQMPVTSCGSGSSGQGLCHYHTMIPQYRSASHVAEALATLADHRDQQSEITSDLWLRVYWPVPSDQDRHHGSVPGRCEPRPRS